MTNVVQLLPTFTSKDAIGNEAAILARCFHQNHYDTSIISEWFSSAAVDRVPVDCFIGERKIDADIVLYHHSTASGLIESFMQASGVKILRYHNVTPPDFFSGYAPKAMQRSAQGLAQLRIMAPHVDLCIAASEFNKRDLIEMGFTCPIEVVPVAIPFEDYRSEPDQKLAVKLSKQHGTKILFVGRIAPNKRQEDIIKAFYYYKKRYDPLAQLYIVGGYGADDRYFASLVQYVEELELDDVVFAGSVSLEQLIAFYQGSDIFLCQSEHEGFCVPLVESMLFDLPVVAYDSTAVGETMGSNTLVLPTKNPEITAEVMHRVMKDDKLHFNVLKAQQARLVDFDISKVQNQFLGIIDSLNSRFS